MQPTPTISPCTEACDLGAGTHHTADDLVAWHNRVYGAGPLAACRVEIGVTDTAEEDVDLDIGRRGIAAGEGKGAQRRFSARRGVPDGLDHVMNLWLRGLDARAR